MRYSRTPLVRSLVKTVSAPRDDIDPKMGRTRGKLEANSEGLPIAVDRPRTRLHAIPTTRIMRPDRSDLRTVGPRKERGPPWPLGSVIGRRATIWYLYS